MAPASEVRLGETTMFNGTALVFGLILTQAEMEPPATLHQGIIVPSEQVFLESSLPSLRPMIYAHLADIIEKSAPQISQCVARYMREKPNETGGARVRVKYETTGHIRAVNIVTKLKEDVRERSTEVSDLRECLDSVANTWLLKYVLNQVAEVSLWVHVDDRAIFSLKSSVSTAVSLSKQQ